MEVNRTNFQELLPQIEEDIESCTFLAIDGEFTGLNNGGGITGMDTPSQYYEKLRSGSLDFLFIQCGLSLFKWIEGNRYSNKTYVFYLFPTPFNRDAPDCRFLCQASSLDFLAKNGFDFNKVFKEGIPYLKQSDEEALREAISERRKFNEANSNSSIKIPPVHQAAVDSAINSIKRLLEPDFTEEEVRIEKCSSFVRKLIYQTVRNQLTGVSLNTKDGVLIANKDDGSKDAKDELELQSAVGFVNIIKAIVNSGKLVVGHNMILDVCHLVQRFVDKLPEDYTEFKEMVHALFPKLIDTKYMWSKEPLKELVPCSVLQQFYETLLKDPFVPPEIESSPEYSCSKEDSYHNAGYDAFTTGICFLSALGYLKSDKNESHPIEKSPILQKYMNKLFLMRTPDTYINLSGNDPVPCRNHVFHVTFPKTWSGKNLTELFSPYGGIQVSWISDTTAWVSLQERGEALRAGHELENKSLASFPGVTVKSYKSVMTPEKRPDKRKASGAASGETPTNRSTARKKRRPSNAVQDPSVSTVSDDKNGKGGKRSKGSVHDLSVSKKATTVEPKDEAIAQNFPDNSDWD